MKQILAAALCLFIFQSASAQIGRGQILLGGSMSYASKTTEIPGNENTQTIITLSPNVGYFFISNLALGGRFSSTITKYENGENQRHVISPFLRMYLLNRAKKVNFLIDGSYSIGKYKNNNFDRDIQGYGVMAGPVVFLGNNVGLEFTVSYLADKMEGSYWNKTIQGGVGLQIHLGKAKAKKVKKKKKETSTDEDDDWWW